jgi:thioredoxin 1
MKRLNNENFNSLVDLEQNLYILKFFSPTCGPCRTMGPVLEHLEAENKNINFYEVDTMESPELAAHFGIRGVPYIAFCENREVLYDFTGVTPMGNLQYVINHIDDPYFRENGEFKKEEIKKKWTFEAIVAFVVLSLILAIIFL